MVSENLSVDGVAALLEADLVDELRLMVFPFVVGTGSRLHSASAGARPSAWSATRRWEKSCCYSPINRCGADRRAEPPYRAAGHGPLHQPMSSAMDGANSEVLADARTILACEPVQASFVASDRSGAGGRLFVTSSYVVFTAHRIDKAVSGASDTVIPFDVIAQVTARRMTEPRYGRMALVRKRVQVVLEDGSEHRFVVNRPEKAAGVLRTAVKAHRRRIKSADGGTVHVTARAPTTAVPATPLSGRHVIVVGRSWQVPLAILVFFLSVLVRSMLTGHWLAAACSALLVVAGVFTTAIRWRNRR